MSSVAICTDSSSLISASAAASLGVEVVPVSVLLDDEPFDELTSSLDWFYARLRAGASAKTSQPTPADFAAAFGRAAARGADTVVSIHVDARVSGTVSSAELAAREAAIPVKVVDTRTASFGVAVCVRAAAETVARGGAAADAVLEAVNLGAQLQNAFVARGSRGGRVPTVGGWSLLRFADGASTELWECGSIEEAVTRTMSLALHGHGDLAAAVGHASRELEPAADRLAHELAASDRVRRVERYRVGASVGAHTGPDTFGAFWWPIRP
jgi:DegV family protein with EDD domain